MLRLIPILLLLLISCTSKERETRTGVNQMQTQSSVAVEGDTTNLNTVPIENQNRVAQGNKVIGGFFPLIADLIFWGFIIIFVVGIAFLIYIKRKQYKSEIRELKRKVSRQEQEIDRITSKSEKSLENHRNRSYRILKKEKEDLEKTVSELQSAKLGKIARKANEESQDFGIENIFKNMSSSKLKHLDKIQELKSKKEELFFTVPEKGGKFKHESGIKSYEEQRFYKIVYSNEEETGELNFISSENDEVAINLKDSMLKRVCKIINENENSPSRVFQISPGKVVRVGEEWVIKEKIKVEIN